ncbi:MAG: N-acetylmuramoyl-L-alanine amidase [Planctomycetota bacterium]
MSVAWHHPALVVLLVWLGLPSLVGCAASTPRDPQATASESVARPAELQRRGDEIVIAGRFFHTGAPVVLWTDPGGYDAYRVERRFVPPQEASWEASRRALNSPNRYGLRFARTLGPDELERWRGGGWTLEDLTERVDQFVLHYDVCGVSRRCFRVLHDIRGLSVHFMIDIDGTIYQTLDVKERAWHAGASNDRSVGVEIANMGAYGRDEPDPFDRWYKLDANGAYITIPPELGDGGVRTDGFVGRPATDGLIIGEIQGRTLAQHDFTTEQYDALARLTATLHYALPNIRLDYPRDSQGKLITERLEEDQERSFQGVLGHFHVSTAKVDPGPAMQWDHLMAESRRHLAGRRPAVADN